MYCFRIAIGFILTAMLFSDGNSAETIPTPDISGHWGRILFNLEAPASGPGPIVNLARKADGMIDDNRARVGDFKNPLLRPDAAAILKQRGEFSLPCPRGVYG